MNARSKPSPEVELERLRRAAMPFFLGYNADPIGDSDLDDEQPIHVYATLGRWRELQRALNYPGYPTAKNPLPNTPAHDALSAKSGETP